MYSTEKFVLITPCRNEEKNLRNLMLSITSQTLRPFLWVIVDDNSTDETSNIIRDFEEQYSWIKGIYRKESHFYMGSHYAYVCNIGFNYALEYCRKDNLDYEFIALVDADNILERTYFETLINKFLEYPSLGIASGISACCDINKIINNLNIKNETINVMSPQFWNLYGTKYMKILRAWDDMPMGSARIWRKLCFNESKGYLPVHSPDSVSNVKAKSKGWETKCFSDAKVIERKGSVKQGLSKGYYERGETNYFLGHSFFYAFLRAMKFNFQFPFYLGIFYFMGYLKSLIINEPRIDDKEVISYYRNRRLSELKKNYIDLLMKRNEK